MREGCRPILRDKTKGGADSTQLLLRLRPIMDAILEYRRSHTLASAVGGLTRYDRQ